MIRGSPRRLVGAAAWLGVTLLAMGLLWLLAGALTRHTLQREAHAEWMQWNSGASPWQWHLQRSNDIVAGHAFGHAQLQSVSGGLQARSLDGSAYEIGLPLTRDADLTRTPHLRVAISASAKTKLWLEVRQHTDGPLCIAAVPLPRASPAIWSLPTLDWRGSGKQSCPEPVRAAMLRLRIQQPAGDTVKVGEVALLPRLHQRMSLSATPIHLPTDPAAARRALQRAASTIQPSTLPQVRLPASSPHHQLALRDLTHALLPAAIVLPASATVAPLAQHAAGSPPAMLKWLALVLYALILAVLAWRPPQRPTRAWLEIAACLAGPLWLIAGLRLRLHTSTVDLAAFVLGLAFAAFIQGRARPRDWRWSGDARAWLLPLALLPVALILAAALTTHGVQLPDAQHATIYLLWAIVQQWLMLTVVLGRLRALLPAYAAILVCAFLFALLHTPNARLMQLCLLAELWWAWCFLRSRALLPIALAHALCALVLQAALVGGWLRSLEVSARFFAG